MTSRRGAAPHAVKAPLHGGLSVEQYAEILAHVRHFAGEDAPDLLARLGVTPEAWEQAEAGFSRALAEEAQEDESDLALVQAFGAAFTSARARLKAERPALAAVNPVVQAQPLREGGAALEESEAAQEVEAAPLAVPAAPAPVFDTAGAQPPSPAAIPKNEREAISPWAKNSGSAPFPAPVGAAPFPLPLRAPEALGGTSLSLDIPRGPALPFKKTDPKAPAAISTPGPAKEPPAAPPRPKRAPEELGGTSMALDVPRGEALPFKKTGAALSSAPASAPVPAVRAEPRPERAEMPADAAEEAPLGPGGEAASLGLEQYASLCVELSLAPDRIPSTLARYRMTPASKEAADRRWSEQFARDPALRATFEKAYVTYRDWLLASGWRPTP